MEYVRTVTEPIIQVTLSENLRGYWDDYHKIDAEVCPSPSSHVFPYPDLDPES